MARIILCSVSATTNVALVLTFAGALLLFGDPHFRIGDDLIDHHVFLVGPALIDPAFQGTADPCSVRTSQRCTPSLGSHELMVTGDAQLGRSVRVGPARRADIYVLVTSI